MQVSFFVKIIDFGRKRNGLFASSAIIVRDGLFASSAIIVIGENSVIV